MNFIYDKSQFLENDTTRKNFRIQVDKLAAEAVKKTQVSLNVVNNYGENISHVAASNNCCELLKELLQNKTAVEKADVKNKFGWTPLMQSLRNGHLQAVKLLLEHGFNSKASTYHGTSTLTLAAAMGRKYFETIFSTNRESLSKTSKNDVSPLCVAAMTNDKGLIMRLMQLGVKISEANEYTLFMLGRSPDPEIRKFGKPLSTINFWNDNSDDIKISEKKFTNEFEKCMEQESRPKKNSRIPKIVIRSASVGKENISPARKTLPQVLILPKEKILSPSLLYNKREALCMSPNSCYKRTSKSDDYGTPTKKSLERISLTYNEQENMCELPSVRGETKIRPKDNFNGSRTPKIVHLKSVDSDNEALNESLGFTPEFRPFSSPNIPVKLYEEAYGEETPTPPRCKTPPSGIVLSSEQENLVLVLEKHGLGCYVSLFIDQEVDWDLFLTLSENDFEEIGVTTKADREKLWKIIQESTTE